MTQAVKYAYFDPTVARNYDRERFTNVPGRVFDRLEKRALAGLIRQVVTEFEHPRILDAPCGTGRITRLLLEEGLDVTAGDVSEPMIEVARQKLGRYADYTDFRRLDLDDLDVEENSFDLVTCIRLFHHLETDERAAVLAQVAKATRRYVVVNISYSSPYYRFRRWVKRRLGQGVSRTCSTWREMEAEAARAGLTIRDWRWVLPGVSEDLLVLLEKTD
ncbi:MAG: methyltransferase domain-containing protein [Phycisphaeraceae bacterium]